MKEWLHSRQPQRPQHDGSESECRSWSCRRRKGTETQRRSVGLLCGRSGKGTGPGGPSRLSPAPVSGSYRSWSLRPAPAMGEPARTEQMKPWEEKPQAESTGSRGGREAEETQTGPCLRAAAEPEGACFLGACTLEEAASVDVQPPDLARPLGALCNTPAPPRGTRTWGMRSHQEEVAWKVLTSPVTNTVGVGGGKDRSS